MSKKAVFLDRDGIINQKRNDYVKSLEEFQINEKIFDVIREIKKKDYLVIIVTNQSAINRKLLTINILNDIHDFFKEMLKRYNLFVDGIYFCPHTPNDNCDCRKPKPGMLLQAARELDVDLENSWIIGDSQTDIDAGNVVGNTKKPNSDIPTEHIKNNFFILVVFVPVESCGKINLNTIVPNEFKINSIFQQFRT